MWASIPLLTTPEREPSGLAGLGVWVCLLKMHNINKLHSNGRNIVKQLFQTINMTFHCYKTKKTRESIKRSISIANKIVKRQPVAFHNFSYLMGFLLASKVVASVLLSEQPNTRNRLLKPHKTMTLHIQVQALWWRNMIIKKTVKLFKADL